MAKGKVISKALMLSIAKDLSFISFRASKPSISLTVIVLPVPLGGVCGNGKLYTPKIIENIAASHIG